VEVCIPTPAEMETMDKTMSPIIKKIITNNLESRTLAALRDTLLPKLLTGQLRIANAL
jgi:type I restriction enzyme S subunit